MELKDRVLYIDEFMAVVQKYPGELCESPSKNTAAEDLKYYIPYIFKDCFEHMLQKKIECVECVHRLDRPVSGVVVIGFSKKICSELSFAFSQCVNKKNYMQKKYWAIVEGKFETGSEFTELTHLVQFFPKKDKSYVKKLDDESAKGAKWKTAKLKYRIAGSGDRYSFLEVELLTGRTHQIRCQLAFEGFHIKGDVKYGARRSDTIDGIRLHARSVELIHPVLKKKMSFISPLPCEDALWHAASEVLVQSESF